MTFDSPYEVPLTSCWLKTRKLRHIVHGEKQRTRNICLFFERKKLHSFFSQVYNEVYFFYKLVRSSQDKTSHVKSSQVKTSKDESSQVKSSQVKYSKIKSSQAKWSQDKLSQAKQDIVLCWPNHWLPYLSFLFYFSW